VFQFYQASQLQLLQVMFAVMTGACGFFRVFGLLMRCLPDSDL